MAGGGSWKSSSLGNGGGKPNSSNWPGEGFSMRVRMAGVEGGYCFGSGLGLRGRRLGGWEDMGWSLRS